MIKLTLQGKLGEVIYLNPHQIEYIIPNADITLVMLSGKRFTVQEKLDTIYTRIVKYRRDIGIVKNEL